jgi:tetratricopeptide (TPR) repeat protein
VSEEALFPGYIHRDEERLILEEAAHVRTGGQSRAVLLYGPGGSGKTTLVRELARTHTSIEQTVWLKAIDVDNPQYWLLSNLEQHVALQLDHKRQFFEPYFTFLSRPSAYAQPQPGARMISRLGRIKRIFQDCYSDFVKSTGKTVVVTLDTVETIRGMYLLLTLTQWMKALPGTLFILSGRPQPDGESDPIKDELEDPYLGMPVRPVWLGRFSQESSFAYLSGSGVHRDITDEERTKLALLAQGQPLWLAFTVSYLNEIGMPEEANVPLPEIQAVLPFDAAPPPQGQLLHEAFKRRLVAPYRDVDFWHEAIKRLAVARQSANQEIWQRLMADKRLPPDAPSWDEAWQRLLYTPWVRRRANSRYVTLHDAVAEELGKRIIPVHDQDVSWRQDLWKRAAAIYADVTRRRERDLDGEQAELERQLRGLDEVPGKDDEARRSAAAEGDLVNRAAALEVRKRDLDQLKAAGLIYQLLCDFEAGCVQYLDWLSAAKRERDVPFADLLTLEMQRLLPGKFRYPLGDVVGDVVGDFHRWLADRRWLHNEIGLSTAEYLIDREQSVAAKELLESLPDTDMEFAHRYGLSILLGNACMRIASEARYGLVHFRRALAEATELRPPECYKYIAEAQNELGYFFRHQGMWREADSAYREALSAIADSLAEDASDEILDEMASIQTNWAYVKGLEGFYREGANLAESAIAVRRRIGNRRGEAISQSVRGEVYRYERRFGLAWRAYERAEEIFQELHDWSWLGIIYQEQAICLFQADQDDVCLTVRRDQLGQAKRLAVLALDICHDFERAYPSALNRAGRIFSEDDLDRALSYLRVGIDVAKELSDGWFWFANLIEYAELSYAAWLKTGNPAYHDQIEDCASGVREATAQYKYPDLRGRWLVLQGYLRVRAWQDDQDVRHLNEALDLFARGFALIAEGYMGSSGAAAIPGQFESFRKLLHELPPDIYRQWLRQLRQEWSVLPGGSDLLLARIAELY